MEARIITVKTTGSQETKEIMSNATTLAELKADLRANGIDYEGMTFYEGVSHTELKTDAAVLPTNVPYRGTITNNLVFLLTKTNKNIRSGMTRTEAYSLIKTRNYEAEIKALFGKNYTNCGTVDLVNFITDKAVDACQNPVTTSKSEELDTLRTALIILVDALPLDKKLQTKLLEVLSENISAPRCYSDEEIEEMFDFVD